ncbi:alanine aminotransferase, putative [Entamoeba histolytica HM-1:IMSS-B]|uniref:Alanine aminotransferase, putative n=5 Tax=Entamoeba histolytica TaxID=5759 RepID=C4LWI5_ENTH1|nr:alanine aminotransferase, putative [Entamoeba histolytica HM-1:IMSS]EMD49099.1 alanine aminotransferase, putative [Entamoeba histolytica KU27]EMH72823.1 alanine aminotransferase, putative [Entamoeba histolytica HM-1:IMSS-B]ENY60539.1 alanine aminotransferase, putative [Entamoeba histolytica HM-1:IMSS-A]GAT93072.1 alanine aminotransferase putative [Entamoeba histolytica]EAL50292.1 alanine aminotransferase, putative [Entamoeba histolytica HM-1:IMSS]|eukprot:XP_655674.1 alanine aminotransferase, putative [Entamoeba histolytica HM-1:IMSS]
MRSFASENISPDVVAFQFAVRGKIAIVSEEIDNAIKKAKAEGKPNPYPFEKVVKCNSGNPQLLNQKPLTFVREITSMVEYPPLTEHPELFHADAVARAKEIIKATGCNGTTGAYSPSKGLAYVRQTIARFLEERDNVPMSPEDIYLTDGASIAIKIVMQLMLSHPLHGIMIPNPQYPLYGACIQQLGGKTCHYNLNEDNYWLPDINDIKEQYEKYQNEGIKIKALVVINPGNPCGEVLPVDTIKEIIRFCNEKKICLMADEVYQENIWTDVPFNSFRKILATMEPEIAHGLELISFHSISKGFYGECGKRGGMFACTNIPEFARLMMYKIISTTLCSNVVGQVVMSIICNLPKEGDPSYPLFKQERDEILGSLKRKAEYLCDIFNKCEGMSCNRAAGAMYLFPRITLPEKFIKECHERHEDPNETYCIEMLKKTGIAVVKGSGFGQKKGTYHFRIALLPPENEIEEVGKRIQVFHNSFIQQYK